MVNAFVEMFLHRLRGADVSWFAGRRSPRCSDLRLLCGNPPGWLTARISIVVHHSSILRSVTIFEAKAQSRRDFSENPVGCSRIEMRPKSLPVPPTTLIRAA